MLPQCILAGLLICTCLVAVPAAFADETTPLATVPTSSMNQREQSPPEQVGFNKAYFKSFVDDYRTILTAPARWDRSDWLTTSLLTGASVALYLNDASIKNWTLDNKTKTISDIGDKVTLLGSGALTVVLIGGMYGYGTWADDNKAKETALLSIESFVLTGVTVQVVKRTAGRHRPYTGDPYNTWGGPSMNEANDSFPSGHSSSAFAVATVIAEEYDTGIVPALAYTTAAITGLNRIVHNAHWASDVFVGSVVGYYTGKTIVASHRGKNRERVSIAPISDGEMTGLALNYRY